MSHSITRRSALAGFGAVSITASDIGGSLVGSAKAQSNVVRVTHFGGPFQALQALAAEPFQKANLGRVEYSVELAMTALTKVQAQRADPPYDVLMVTRALAYQNGRAGILKALSKTDIPTLSEVTPQTLGPGGFGAAFVFDTLSVVADGRQVTTPIESWLDLWRPEFRGKIMLPSSATTVASLLLMSVCRSIGSKQVDDANVELAFQKLKELKPHVRAFYGDPMQANQLVERGDIALAPQMNIRIANLMRQNPNVKRFVPAEGAPLVPFDLVVPARAANQDGAAKYINFILSKQVQTSIVNALLATPVRTDVVPRDDVKQFVITETKNMWPVDEEYVATRQRGWLDRWTREIQA
jgi:putative spermidine/putrescine transport system substrate-binding protein